MTLAEAQARDAADPLAHTRARFALPDGALYLDGNSLGALPRDTAAAVGGVVTEQWGRDLIASWNRHDWIGLSRRLGAMIAPIIGADGDEVIVCETTSVNALKLIAAALQAQPGRPTCCRKRQFCDRSLYGRKRRRAGGSRLRTVESSGLAAAIDDDTALLPIRSARR